MNEPLAKYDEIHKRVMRWISNNGCIYCCVSGGKSYYCMPNGSVITISYGPCRMTYCVRAQMPPRDWEARLFLPKDLYLDNVYLNISYRDRAGKRVCWACKTQCDALENDMASCPVCDIARKDYRRHGVWPADITCL